MRESIASLVNGYVDRFGVAEKHFTHPPDGDLCLILTIPSFKEHDLAGTLHSLSQCQAPSGQVELIVMINAPEDATVEEIEANRLTFVQLKKWEEEKPDFLRALVIREESIPTRQAGAGTARKIAMDEAVQRWAMIEKDGPVICLDADCLVSKNYLVAAESFYLHQDNKVGHFHFEHDFQKEDDADLRNGIVDYELHLRCYVRGLKLAAYPFAIHTVGSCMSVRTSAYARSGGMNRRKAGEDFYFLHKLVPITGWKYIAEATVFPSCRISDRVPFGTGRSQLDKKYKNKAVRTYNPGIYESIKAVFEILPNSYRKDVHLGGFETPVRAFLEGECALERIEEMRANATSTETFKRRFWQWMDGFKVLKLVHFLRDQGMDDQLPIQAAHTLLARSKEQPSSSTEGTLLQLRKLDQIQL